jgi:ABC-2 type transport system permease protein
MASRMLNILATETGAELTQSFRAPEFVLPTLALPAAFYLVFGVMMARSASASAYLLATYGVFAVMGPALFGFGVGVASERERGWLELKRAAPAPAMTFVGAKLAATIAFATMALVPVYVAGAFLGGVALPRTVWLGLFAVHLAAVVPFALIGLAIGFRFGTSGAVAIANIVFLGLAVLGGLWFPAALFPDWLGAVARLLPSFHLAEIALGLVQPDGSRRLSVHAAVLAGMTVCFAVLTARAWFRQR